MSKVAQILTQNVLNQLENGIVPWHKPWTTRGLRPMGINGNDYRGINFFLMSMLGHARPVYITFKQIKTMGGKIKDGCEKNIYPVYFFTSFKVEDTLTGNEKDIPCFRYYSVYNIEDVDGITLPKKTAAKLEAANAEPTEFQVHDAAEAVVEGYNNRPEIRHGGDRACYSPVIDKINMPEREAFHTRNDYYATLFHEMVHSTGHSSRLNRADLMASDYFGGHAYSREELVAEMGAAMLASHCGIMTDVLLDNSAAYLAAWASKIKSEPNLLVTAAARAQKAMDHILGTKFEKDAEE